MHQEGDATAEFAPAITEPSSVVVDDGLWQATAEATEDLHRQLLETRRRFDRGRGEPSQALPPWAGVAAPKVVKSLSNKDEHL